MNIQKAAEALGLPLILESNDIRVKNGVLYFFDEDDCIEMARVLENQRSERNQHTKRNFANSCIAAWTQRLLEAMKQSNALLLEKATTGQGERDVRDASQDSITNHLNTIQQWFDWRNS